MTVTFCDRCGKRIPDTDQPGGIEVNWYCTDEENEIDDMEMCESCMREIIDFIKKPGGKHTK